MSVGASAVLAVDSVVADVLELALPPGALIRVPLATDLVITGQSRSASLRLRLRGATGSSDSCRGKVGDLERGEATNTAKFNVDALGDMLSNGLVKVDDAAVVVLVKHREKRLDIVAVSPEFETPVWEGVDDGLCGKAKHVIPLKSRCDAFRRFCDASGEDADLADLVNNLVIKVGREGAGVDCVEINGAVGEHTRPLQL